MADKLSLFNGALRLLGERTLVSLSEDREPKRILDSVWYGNEAIKVCLEQGLWNFAMRSVELPYAPAVTPAFGFEYAFEKPDDFIRTAYFCSDEEFRMPILTYMDNTGYWYAHQDTVYVRYVSMDTDTGLDVSLWPGSFSKYVEAYLANEIAPRITENTERRADVYGEMRMRLKVARSRDAMEDPTREVGTLGTWTGSRGGWGHRRMHRGTN